MMKFIKTEIEGLIIIEPPVFKDNRGCFFEAYNTREFLENGITASFVQDNHSMSHKGVIRGLHFQIAPHEQGKLVRVSGGRVMDVAVDLRPGSASFGRTFSIELSSENNKMLWIPVGFAHGFECLTEKVLFTYKVTKYYNPESERGIRYDDPELKIKWNTASPIVSTKDLELPYFKEYSASVQ